MAQGGLHVGIVGTEKNQMVAIANTIRELVEIRKFAVNLEEVLSIEYDKSKFAGNYVTDEERIKHNLPAKESKEEHDELWLLRPQSGFFLSNSSALGRIGSKSKLILKEMRNLNSYSESSFV